MNYSLFYDSCSKLLENRLNLLKKLIKNEKIEDMFLTFVTDGQKIILTVKILNNSIENRKKYSLNLIEFSEFLKQKERNLSCWERIFNLKFKHKDTIFLEETNILIETEVKEITKKDKKEDVDFQFILISFFFIILEENKIKVKEEDFVNFLKIFEKMNSFNSKDSKEIKIFFQKHLNLEIKEEEIKNRNKEKFLLYILSLLKIDILSIDFDDYKRKFLNIHYKKKNNKEILSLSTSNFFDQYFWGFTHTIIRIKDGKINKYEKIREHQKRNIFKNFFNKDCLEQEIITSDFFFSFQEFWGEIVKEEEKEEKKKEYTQDFFNSRFVILQYIFVVINIIIFYENNGKEIDQKFKEEEEKKTPKERSQVTSSIFIIKQLITTTNFLEIFKNFSFTKIKQYKDIILKKTIIINNMLQQNITCHDFFQSDLKMKKMVGLKDFKVEFCLFFTKEKEKKIIKFTSTKKELSVRNKKLFLTGDFTNDYSFTNETLISYFLKTINFSKILEEINRKIDKQKNYQDIFENNLYVYFEINIDKKIQILFFQIEDPTQHIQNIESFFEIEAERGEYEKLKYVVLYNYILRDLRNIDGSINAENSLKKIMKFCENNPIILDMNKYLQKFIQKIFSKKGLFLFYKLEVTSIRFRPRIKELVYTFLKEKENFSKIINEIIEETGKKDLKDIQESIDNLLTDLKTCDDSQAESFLKKKNIVKNEKKDFTEKKNKNSTQEKTIQNYYTQKQREDFQEEETIENYTQKQTQDFTEEKTIQNYRKEQEESFTEKQEESRSKKDQQKFFKKIIKIFCFVIIITLLIFLFKFLKK